MQTSVSDAIASPTVRVFDAVRALAFIGDLSMGQPTDHSLRTAWLAAQIAQAAELGEAACVAVREASLLRWSGCTANAAGFADALGDDVASREAMLAGRPGWADPLEAQGGAETIITPLAQIHCEVSGEVARMLGLTIETQTTLRHIFEAWDGSGFPDHLPGPAVPETVLVVAVAGDLEILSRVYGVEQALMLIAQRADKRYPARIVELAARHAQQWMAALDAQSEHDNDATRADSLRTPAMDRQTTIELIADVIDLKLPWMTGYSRAVANTAAECAAHCSLDAQTCQRIYSAGLIHGIGRAAVSNTVWNVPSRLSTSAWEKVRLVPYWTARAGGQTGTLAEAATLASHAYERADGSGYFRGMAGAGLSLEARILGASAAWVALRSARPWREALSDDEAAGVLREEAAKGRWDADVVEALIASGPAPKRAVQANTLVNATGHALGNPSANARLSAREIDVLRAISKGASNKEAARELELSPSTVRTHVENVFRKLECSTRAAATLKAAAMGVL
ncbi:LuxR family transcriptional regulator [Pararobbsia alpina]|uniref:HD domain-containing phosphohydrolase n=1 Tax=Pararobbsia alpina TaxID=621374 RepID=UPI0039A41215